jgi:RNA polymerase sigma-70 factor (ECF subfamily)
MLSTPVSLLERLRHLDDGDAWSEFVRLYTPILYDWARRAGLTEEESADLLQDVFATLVQELPRFHYQPGKSFRSWMHTILLNRWRTLQRRRRPQTITPGSLDALAAVADPALPGEAEELRALVRNALVLIQGQFSAETWQAFREHAMAGRPAAEVAAELGLTVNAVYLARSRVLRRLREKLQGLIE